MKVGVRLALTLVLGLLLLVPSPAAAQDTPPLPHQFYGSIDIYSQEDMSDLHAAPADTVISAYSEGTKTGSITTTEVGKYGGPGGADLKLMVQGDIAQGSQISFQVKLPGGAEGEANQTASFHSGDIEELNLTAYCLSPPSDGGGGGGFGSTTGEVSTDLFGTEAISPISSIGRILETIEATSEDGTLTLTVLEGTIALDKEDNPVISLESEIDTSPPLPPEDANIIGVAYNFGPDGTTFAPPITLTWSYDPDDISEGVAEEDLVLAWYDEAADEWVELDCIVDTENNTITASVEHFTTFAIIGTVTPPPEVVPPEEEEVAPPEEEEVAPPEEEEIAPPEEEEVAPPEEVLPPEEVAPPEEVLPPAKPPINWTAVGVVIAGVVVAGLLIFFLARRRA